MEAVTAARLQEFSTDLLRVYYGKFSKCVLSICCASLFFCILISHFRSFISICSDVFLVILHGRF